MSTFEVDREALKRRLSPLAFNITQEGFTEKYGTVNSFPAAKLIFCFFADLSPEIWQTASIQASTPVLYASKTYLHRRLSTTLSVGGHHSLMESTSQSSTSNQTTKRVNIRLKY